MTSYSDRLRQERAASRGQPDTPPTDPRIARIRQHGFKISNTIGSEPFDIEPDRRDAEMDTNPVKPEHRASPDAMAKLKSMTNPNITTAMTEDAPITAEDFIKRGDLLPRHRLNEWADYFTRLAVDDLYIRVAHKATKQPIPMPHDLASWIANRQNDRGLEHGKIIGSTLPQTQLDRIEVMLSKLVSKHG